MKIRKISGTFSAIGDVVQLQIPTAATEVALRLYEETKEIAVFVIEGAIGLENLATRSFLALSPVAELPENFMKYIGAIGLPEEAFIIEVS